MAAALVLSATFVPAASAETDFATIKLTKYASWFGGDSSWTTRSGYTGSFDVDITNVVGHDEQGLSVFISLPIDDLVVTGHEGEDWECRQVNEGPGAEGLMCTQDHLIVHEEAWPTLKVHTRAGIRYLVDSIDVYADAGGHETVHTGVAFKIDTST